MEKEPDMHKRGCFWAIVLCFMYGQLYAQNVAQKSIKVNRLSLLDAIHFDLPAPVASSPWNYCDSEGNVYSWISTMPVQPGPAPVNLSAIGLNLMAQPVMKLSLSTQEITKYSLPPGIHNMGKVFTVDSEGDVYRIYADYKNYHIVKYNHDGTIDSAARLRSPDGEMFNPSNVIVFGDGDMLITGIARPLAPKINYNERNYNDLTVKTSRSFSGWRPFTAIFDGHGHILSVVKLPENRKNTETPSRAGSGRPGADDGSMRIGGVKAVWGTLMAAGTDGEGYIVRPTNPPVLYAIDSNGQVIHRAEIREYESLKYRPVLLASVGKSELMIEFVGMKLDKKFDMRPVHLFAVVDGNTGKSISTYRFPRRTGIFPVCATSPNSFEFLGSSKQTGKLEVLRYSGN